MENHFVAHNFIIRRYKLSWVPTTIQNVAISHVLTAIGP